MTNNPTKNEIRTAVRSFYDAQKLRIQTGQRISANMHVKLGIKPSTKKSEASTEALKLLNQAVGEYEKITDAFVSPNVRTKIRAIEEKGTGIITNTFELDLVNHYLSLKEDEKSLEKSIEYLLGSYPIYKEYLKNVKGCGPLMSAVIISELDPYSARHASSFCKYAGLDVVVNEAGKGEGRGRKLAHQVEVTYTNRSGKEDTKMSITFNPFLKTKLLGVLASSFLKCKNEKYAKMYYDYKFRLQNRPDTKDFSDMHRHNMASRYMIKQFLLDLWAKWRELEDLEVTPTYAEAKLGIHHGQDLSVQAKMAAEIA